MFLQKTWVVSFQIVFLICLCARILEWQKENKDIEKYRRNTCYPWEQYDQRRRKNWCGKTGNKLKRRASRNGSSNVCAFLSQISPFLHLFGRPECVSLAEKCTHLEVPLDYELIEPEMSDLCLNSDCRSGFLGNAH